jgi:hypothetical protein
LLGWSLRHFAWRWGLQREIVRCEHKYITSKWRSFWAGRHTRALHSGEKSSIHFQRVSVVIRRSFSSNLARVRKPNFLIPRLIQYFTKPLS